MKVLATILTSVFASTAMAGDGGFDLWTCISESGRTNLTIYSDNYSGAKIPARVVLGIDGKFVTHEHYLYDVERAEEEICEDDCTQVNFTRGGVTVSNGDHVSLQIDLKGKKATIRKGFYNPSTEQTSASSIELSCKTFHQAP